MSLQYLDGCDNYSPLNGSGLSWDGGTAPQIVAGRTGNCLQFPNTRIKLNFPASGITATEYYTFGCAMYIDLVSYQGSDGRVISFTAGGNDEQQIFFRPGGVIAAAKYYQNFLGQSLPSVLPLRTWFYLEVQVYHHSSAGSFKVWLNGVQIINVVGTATRYNYPLIDAVILENYGANNRYDDIYLCSGTSLEAPFGDCQVDTLVPTGSGTVSQWAGSDGDSVNNWQLVDEQPAAMTDYVQSGTAGQQDLYTMSDLVPNSGVVRAVAACVTGAKDEIGPRSVKPLVRRAATNAGAALPLDGGSSPIMKQAVFLTDPETGAAWTQPNINAAEFGIEVV